MNKRGQVTAFVIISILVIASLALFFTLKSNKEESASFSGNSLRDHVNHCLEQTSEEVIFRVGSRGGHYNYSDSPRSTNEGIPYYLLNESSHIPSIKRIESEISFGIKKEMPSCLGSLSDFENYRDSGNLSSSVRILDDAVRVNIEYPVIIGSGESTSRITEFSHTSSLDIRKMHNSANSYVKQNFGRSGVCMTCLDRIVTENNLYSEVYFSESTNDTALIRFSDRNSELNDEYFEWVFANGY